MRDTLVRINGTVAFPAGSYVKSVGHDGSFTITSDKAKARRFLPATAAATIARLSNTRMTFDTCPAPEAVHA